MCEFNLPLNDDAHGAAGSKEIYEELDEGERKKEKLQPLCDRVYNKCGDERGNDEVMMNERLPFLCLFRNDSIEAQHLLQPASNP